MKVFPSYLCSGDEVLVVGEYGWNLVCYKASYYKRISSSDVVLVSYVQSDLGYLFCLAVELDVGVFQEQRPYSGTRQRQTPEGGGGSSRGVRVVIICVAVISLF